MTSSYPGMHLCDVDQVVDSVRTVLYVGNMASAGSLLKFILKLFQYRTKLTQQSLSENNKVNVLRLVTISFGLGVVTT